MKPVALTVTRKVRVSMALRLLMECTPATVAAAQIMEEHGVALRTAWRDVATARDQLTAHEHKQTLEVYQPQAIATAERHYMKCLKEGDMKAGLRTLQWVAELHGFQRSPQGVVNIQQNIQQTHVQQLMTEAQQLTGVELEARLIALRKEQGDE